MIKFIFIALIMLPSFSFASDTPLSFSFNDLNDRILAAYSQFGSSGVSDSSRIEAVSTTKVADEVLVHFTLVDADNSGKVSAKTYRTFYPQCEAGGECSPLAEEVK